MSTEADAPFTEPWHARLFALTEGVLTGCGVPRERFRQHLIAAIGDAPDRPYWESWLGAFEALLVELELTSGEEIADAMLS